MNFFFSVCRTKKGYRVDSGRGLSLDLEGEEYDSCHSEPNLSVPRTDEAPDIPRPFSSTAVLDPSRHHQTETLSTGRVTKNCKITFPVYS